MYKQNYGRPFLYLIAILATANAAASGTEQTPEQFSYMGSVRVQFMSDLWKATGSQYDSLQHDLYLRRSRLDGAISHGRFRFVLEVAGDINDRAPQNRITDQPSVDDGNGTMHFTDTFAEYSGDNYKFRIGKSKMPLSRVYLVSSAEQLFWERPVYTEYLRSFYRRYVDSNIQGIYMTPSRNFYVQAAIADGWNSGDEPYTGQTVTSSSPLLALRMEFSPIYGLEAKKSDGWDHPDSSAISAYIASQNKIQYGTYSEKRVVHGVDIHFRHSNFFMSGEINKWTVRNGINDLDGKGWYIQAGLLYGRYEPAIRFEAARESNDPFSDLRSTDVGLNYYLSGHDLKFGFDVLHIRGQYLSVDGRPETIARLGLQARIRVKGNSP